MEAIYRDYSPRGVQFYYIYKSLAHPETNGYVAPLTLTERLLHVQEAQRKLGSGIPWLCDGMDNAAKHALGDAPNSEFVIDPDGIIVRRRQWSRPDELRRDLEQLVGAVDRPTRPEEVHLPVLSPPKIAPTGVVPRLQRPQNMRPLVVEATPSDQPYYVKLRAEADPRLLAGGTGTLYLGFHCDPLYHVHWNNLVDPLRFSLRLPNNVTARPASGEGPKVETPSDSDPREFLIEVEHWQEEPITVVIQYFACNDQEGWCKPVQQEFRVFPQFDRDGGTVRRGTEARAPGAGRPMPNRNDPMASGRARPPARFAPGARLLDVRAGERLITVDTPRGQDTLSVAEDALIFRDGERATLADLRPGDRLQLRWQTNPDGERYVTGIRALPSTTR